MNAPEFVPSSSTTIIEEPPREDVGADTTMDETDLTLFNSDESAKADLERLADMKRQNLEQSERIENTRVLLGLQRFVFEDL